MWIHLILFLSFPYLVVFGAHHNNDKCIQKFEEYRICIDDCDSSCTISPATAGRCLPCSTGCFCKHNFARLHGKCVPMKSKKCRDALAAASGSCDGEHEVYKTCHNGCDRTCQPNHNACPQCHDGCYCKNNYARLRDECVPVNSQACLYETLGYGGSNGGHGIGSNGVGSIGGTGIGGSGSGGSGTGGSGIGGSGTGGSGTGGSGTGGSGTGGSGTGGSGNGGSGHGGSGNGNCCKPYKNDNK